MLIGIDLDNTIIKYHGAFVKTAIAESYVPEDFSGKTKTEVRNFLRKFLTEEGEHKWQELQGLVYGRFISNAEIFEGAKDLISQLVKAGNEVYIVSHKTRLAHHDPYKTNLRDAALNFLADKNFFDSTAMRKENIFFEDTKENKIARINMLKLHLFIDDLPEILLHKDFPKTCQAVLFSENACDGLENYSSWGAISKKLAGEFLTISV